LRLPQNPLESHLTLLTPPFLSSISPPFYTPPSLYPSLYLFIYLSISL